MTKRKKKKRESPSSKKLPPIVSHQYVSRILIGGSKKKKKTRKKKIKKDETLFSVPQYTEHDVEEIDNTIHRTHTTLSTTSEISFRGKKVKKKNGDPLLQDYILLRFSNKKLERRFVEHFYGKFFSLRISAALFIVAIGCLFYIGMNDIFLTEPYFSLFLLLEVTMFFSYILFFCTSCMCHVFRPNIHLLEAVFACTLFLTVISVAFRDIHLYTITGTFVIMNEALVLRLRCVYTIPLIVIVFLLTSSYRLSELLYVKGSSYVKEFLVDQTFFVVSYGFHCLIILIMMYQMENKERQYFLGLEANESGRKKYQREIALKRQVKDELLPIGIKELISNNTDRKIRKVLKAPKHKCIVFVLNVINLTELITGPPPTNVEFEGGDESDFMATCVRQLRVLFCKIDFVCKKYKFTKVACAGGKYILFVSLTAEENEKVIGNMNRSDSSLENEKIEKSERFKKKLSELDSDIPESEMIKNTLERKKKKGKKKKIIVDDPATRVITLVNTLSLSLFSVVCFNKIGKFFNIKIGIDIDNVRLAIFRNPKTMLTTNLYGSAYQMANKLSKFGVQNSINVSEIVYRSSKNLIKYKKKEFESSFIPEVNRRLSGAGTESTLSSFSSTISDVSSETNWSLDRSNSLKSSSSSFGYNKINSFRYSYCRSGFEQINVVKSKMLDRIVRNLISAENADGIKKHTIAGYEHRFDLVKVKEEDKRERLERVDSKSKNENDNEKTIFQLLLIEIPLILLQLCGRFFSQIFLCCIGFFGLCCSKRLSSVRKSFVNGWFYFLETVMWCIPFSQYIPFRKYFCPIKKNTLKYNNWLGTFDSIWEGRYQKSIRSEVMWSYFRYGIAFIASQLVYIYHYSPFFFFPLDGPMLFPEGVWFLFASSFVHLILIIYVGVLKYLERSMKFSERTFRILDSIARVLYIIGYFLYLPFYMSYRLLRLEHENMRWKDVSFYTRLNIVVIDVKIMTDLAIVCLIIPFNLIIRIVVNIVFLILTTLNVYFINWVFLEKNSVYHNDPLLGLFLGWNISIDELITLSSVLLYSFLLNKKMRNMFNQKRILEGIKNNLTFEKEKSSKVLQLVLPQAIIRRLNFNRRIPSNHVSEFRVKCSIGCLKIIGLDDLIHYSTEVMYFIGDLFTHFDETVTNNKFIRARSYHSKYLFFDLIGKKKKALTFIKFLCDTVDYFKKELNDLSLKLQKKRKEYEYRIEKKRKKKRK